ncbi:MAG: hypothetical protein K940chlam6_00567 [Chlamydiae bacterium]|nr:hypothetical protein [Chlamydiota bacterium]
MVKNLFLVLGLATSCFAATGKHIESSKMEECPGPWFTGPLLAPAGHVVPKGYINIEPYVFYTVTTGNYNSNWKTVNLPNFTSANFQFLLYIGITEWADIQLIPQASWNETKGVSSLELGDFAVEFDVQAMEDTKHNSLPGLKFYVRENFPTGHYQKRDPEKFTTDVGGSGSFETTFGFVITTTHEPWYCHFLNLRLNGFITFPTKVHVKGLNAYGGAPDTDATVKPGLEWGGIFALQYNFTQNWAFAVDIEGIYGNKTTFKGFPGTFLPSTPPNVFLGNPSNVSFGIAPAIEYNFNESVGIIGGVWLTFAGRNTPHFYSGVIAINYYGPIAKGERHKYRTRGGSGGSGGGGGGR